MADENAPPSNSTDPAGGVANGIRVILGRNPVVLPKKAYNIWSSEQKHHLAKLVKNRAAHLPKRKGSIPVATAWDLVLNDLKGDAQSRFTNVDMSNGKTLQTTFNRFRDEVLKANGVTKDAINTSGLARVDPYTHLMLAMEEERFKLEGHAKERTEAGKRKRKILGNIAGQVINAQGGQQATPAAPAPPLLIPDGVVVDETPDRREAVPEPQTGSASQFIHRLTASIRDSIGGNSELKQAQLEAARAQTTFYQLQTQQMQMQMVERMAPSRRRYEHDRFVDRFAPSSSSSSSFASGCNPFASFTSSSEDERNRDFTSSS